MAIWRCEIYSKRRRRGTWSLKRHKLALTHTHTQARKLYLIFPALNNITVQEKIKLFTACTTKQIRIYLT